MQFKYSKNISYTANLRFYKEDISSDIPFSLHKINKNSATRSLTDVTGVVKSRHNWFLRVFPFSGGSDTSLNGGSTACLKNFL